MVTIPSRIWATGRVKVSGSNASKTGVSSKRTQFMAQKYAKQTGFAEKIFVFFQFSIVFFEKTWF
jgi:hypothetical protein